MFDNLDSFIGGLVIGTGLTMVSSYYFGTKVVNKSLQYYFPSVDNSHHLQYAQDILESSRVYEPPTTDKNSRGLLRPVEESPLTSQSDDDQN